LNQVAVNVGLAGLGNFGKLHARVLSQLPQARIAAICDPDEGALAQVGDAFGVEWKFRNFDRMLAESELDCLFLVTPEQLHAEMALKAIAKGLPIFMEKPLATSSAEGKKVVVAVKDAGVYLQIGFVLRFETQHAFLKQQIAVGKFGEIVSVRVKRNCSKAWMETYGDRAHSVFETIIHDIDLLLWLTGQRCEKVYAVQRHLSGHTFPDACFAMLQFDGGAVGLAETSWLVPNGAPANVLTESWGGTIDAELEVIGTRQSAKLRILESGLSIWTPDAVQHPEPGLWPEVHGQIAGALAAEDAHFLECVHTGKPSTVASLDDALAGLTIAETIITSAEVGQEITFPK
jgi:predicted dehydrogenase